LAVCARPIAASSNSDLPGEVFEEAAAVAMAMAIAHTGKSRSRWPAYWDGLRAKPCCTDVTIHAAGLRRHLRYPDDLQAAVAWTGQPRPQVYGSFNEQITQLRLSPTTTADGDPYDDLAR
jgi:hypothetical protein